MRFKGLLKKRISVKKGKKILDEYCEINGFEGNGTEWKKPTHARHWFAYNIGKRTVRSRNWVAYHYMREDKKYSVWIDLVTEEIRENLKSPA